LPHRKSFGTESTSAVDVYRHRLPVVHEWCHFTTVHQA
jgi:hypothetical protein